VKRIGVNPVPRSALQKAIITVEQLIVS